MNVRGVLFLLSIVLLVIAASMAACWWVSITFADPPAAQRALLQSALIVLVIGAVLLAFTRAPGEFSRRDGFIIVTGGWLLAAAAGSLPFLLSGVTTDLATALFETMAGFTTTGASAFDNLEAMPRGIMFWRCLTQWLGGMGVLVLCVAILPFLGVGGMQIYRAEMPGPSKDRLTPRITTTAKLLYGVYLLLSVGEVLLLRAGGMSWYDALCHTFTTVSTGGFSTRTASIAAYNSFYLEGVMVAFMFLAGMNFSLHFRALRGDVGSYFRDPECRFYIVFWLLACLFVGLTTWHAVYPSLGDALRAGCFQVTSLMTTTGFCTANYDEWPASSRLVLLLVMFTGACAGSTSGGIKIVRVFVVLKKAVREIRMFMQPQAVFQIKLGRKPVDRNVVDNIAAFFIIYIHVFALATIAMSFFTPDLITALSSVIATLGNVGPGLGEVGPARSFSAIPGGGKLLLSACMLLGRLELYTVLVLLLPGFWKK